MASNRRWRWQFRCRGSRRESAVAQLFSLGSIERMTKQFAIPKEQIRQLVRPMGGCFITDRVYG